MTITPFRPVEVSLAPTAGTGSWQAIHIYYASNPVPMLTTCLRPLIAELTAEGLLAGHWFINYWVEGPHVRLRLKPSSEAVTEQVLQRTEEAVAAFCRRRPALYQVDTGFLNDFYNTLFDAEFTAEERLQYVGADGRMNLRQNNTTSREAYEPELAKYGGPAGIELAEWHFQASSELVVEAMATKNLHVRPVLLGTSAQLMMVMGQAFLPHRPDLASFYEDYYKFWHYLFPSQGFIGDREYENAYTGTDDLVTRFDFLTGTEPRPGLRRPEWLQGWAEHCAQLRDRVLTLHRNGDLVFRSWDRTHDEQPRDAADALTRLLSPYLHMTNNRLQVTIRDEAYLAYVLGRALREADAGVGDPG